MAVPYIFGTIIGGASIPLSELDDNFDYLATSPTFTGNVTVSGTFNVSGATTISNTLNVLGAATLSNTLNVSGATVLSNTLSVSGSATFGSSLTLGNQQTVQGSLILANTAAGAFQTTIQSSNSASAAWTLTLPTTGGTNNYVLTTNGSGVSSWSQVSLTAGVTGTLPTGNGGTGITGFTAANNAIYSTSASALTAGTLPIAAGGTGGTTDSQARTNLGLGTAAVKNTGSTADTIPLLDANGQLLNQRVAASAGWGAVTKSVGVSNESGIYFDALNNSEIGARDGSGNLRVRWQTVSPSSNLVDGIPAYVCRAWVNFNGTGTPAIRAAGNVTSITDNGTGDYTINFAVAMTDVNYSAVSSTGNTGNFGTQPEAYNTGSFQLTTRNTGTAALSDNAYVNVAIFR